MLYLGHGRALEAYLIGVKFLFGLSPIWPIDALALVDLQWQAVPASIIGLPFLLIGSLQLIGWIMNVRGLESSWKLRAAGAWLGICLWVWIIIKSIAIGQADAAIFRFCLMSLIASTWLFWKAWNRLPIPGTPGAA